MGVTPSNKRFRFTSVHFYRGPMVTSYCSIILTKKAAPFMMIALSFMKNEALKRVVQFLRGEDIFKIKVSFFGKTEFF